MTQMTYTYTDEGVSKHSYYKQPAGPKPLASLTLGTWRNMYRQTHHLAPCEAHGRIFVVPNCFFGTERGWSKCVNSWREGWFGHNLPFRSANIIPYRMVMLKVIIQKVRWRDIPKSPFWRSKDTTCQHVKGPHCVSGWCFPKSNFGGSNGLLTHLMWGSRGSSRSFRLETHRWALLGGTTSTCAWGAARMEHPNLGIKGIRHFVNFTILRSS